MKRLTRPQVIVIRFSLFLYFPLCSEAIVYRRVVYSGCWLKPRLLQAHDLLEMLQSYSWHIYS